MGPILAGVAILALTCLTPVTGLIIIGAPIAVSALASRWVHAHAAADRSDRPSGLALATVIIGACACAVFAVLLFAGRHRLGGTFSPSELQALFLGAVLMLIGLLYALVRPHRDL